MNRKYQQCALAIAVALSANTYAGNYGAWSNAVPAPGINTAAAEGCPIESPDGRYLYFMSTRNGGLDNWRATWNFPMHSWDHVTNLGEPANSPTAADYCPTPLPGRWLLFVSSRQNSEDCAGCKAMPPPPAGSPPAGDIFLTRENPAHGFGTPVDLGGYADGGPNTKGSEYSPSVVETAEGTFLYFSSDGYPDSKSHDIYMSRMRADGSFGPGVRVAELSSDAADLMPNVRRDGLEIVFSSNRASADPRNQDIWYATRRNTRSPWSVRGPIENPAVNTPDGAETRATLSGDGTRLYFGRKHFTQVPADPGDVYVSTRVKLNQGHGHRPPEAHDHGGSGHRRDHHHGR
jgi:Tol biopolymer transport system component